MLLLALLVAAAPVRVSIEAGDLSHRLERRIEAEIPELTITSSAAADVRVTMRRADGELIIDVSGRSGPMGTRSIPTSEGTEPALRLATLLTVRAVETVRSLEEPLEIPAPPGSYSIYASAGLFTAWWSEPFRPTIGFGAGGGIDFRAFELGLLFVELGRPWGAGRRAGRIDGEATELMFLLDGSFSLVRWGVFWLRIRAAAGVNLVRFEAVNALPESQVEGVVRVAMSPDVEIVRDVVWFGLSGGVWWRVGAARFSNIDDEQVFAGHLVPFADARLSVHFP